MVVRHATKLLLASCVATAVVGGLVPASATASTSTPASTAARTPSAALDCAAERAALVAVATTAKGRIAQLDRARIRVVEARTALRKADGGRESAQAASRLQRARAVKRAAKVRQSRALTRVHLALARYQACQDGSDPDPDPDPTPGPLQPLCDLGLLQAVCDALDALPLPGGAGGTSPIQPLCEAGLPQPICDAATGLPRPGGASAIQPLCDAGLPQGICDVAEGALDVRSLPIPDGLPGLPEFAFAGVAEVPGLDLLIGLLSPVTGVVPLGTICDAIDIAIVCDLVAP